MKKSIIIVFIVLLTLCATSVSVYAESYITKINIVQTAIEQEKVFFELCDQNGNNIDNNEIQLDHLQIAIGDEQVELSEIQPFMQTNQPISLVIAVDVSKSISESSFSNIREVLLSLLSNLNSEDQVLLMTFGEEINIIAPFTTVNDTFIQQVNELTLTDNYTKFYDGVHSAIELAKSTKIDMPARTSILLVTDGINDSENSVTKTELEKALDLDALPVYGFNIVKETSDNEFFGQLCRESGGKYFLYKPDAKDTLPQIIFNGIKGGYVAKYTGLDNYNGETYNFQLKYITDQSEYIDAVNIRPFPSEKEVQEEQKIEITPTPKPQVEVQEEVETEAIPVTTDVQEANESSLNRNYIFGIFLVVVAILLLVIMIIKKRKNKSNNQPAMNEVTDQSIHNSVSINTVKDNEKTVFLGSTQTSDMGGLNKSLVGMKLEFYAIGEHYYPPSTVYVKERTFVEVNTGTNLVFTNQINGGTMAVLEQKQDKCYITPYNQQIILINGLKNYKYPLTDNDIVTIGSYRYRAFVTNK